MKIIRQIKDKLSSHTKKQEQEELIKVLRKPEDQRRRPAAKFASNRTR